MNYYQYAELSHHTTTKTILLERRRNPPVGSGLFFFSQFIKIKNAAYNISSIFMTSNEINIIEVCRFFTVTVACFAHVGS